MAAMESQIPSDFIHYSSGGGQAAPDVDVIVIGAGAAGLQAARLLSQRGYSVRVIEARNRVGGRTQSEDIVLPNGRKVHLDVGGQWVGPPQKRVMELIKEFNLKAVEQYHGGINLLEVKQQRFEYSGNISGLAMFANRSQQGSGQAVPELDRVWARLDELARTVDLDRPDLSPDSQALDGQSFGQWTKQHVADESTRNVVDWFVRVCVACEPDELSLLAFLWFLRAGGGYESLVNVEGGAQNFLVDGGTQQLSVRMAKELDLRVQQEDEGDRAVLLGCRVTSINQDLKGVTVNFDHDTEAGTLLSSSSAPERQPGSLRARRIIIAMAPPLINKIHFEPQLPALRYHLMDRMALGSVIKVHILYEKPFWKDCGFSGEFISDEGPLFIGYDKTHEGLCSLVAFIAGDAARRWGERTKEEREHAAVQQLYRLFKRPEALKPLLYHEKDWSEEEFSRGCYFAWMPPGAVLSSARELRRPSGRIHWAGTETSSEWIGYIEGALASGQRAGEEVASLLSQAKL